MKFYAGIGSRETPLSIEPTIQEVAFFLQKMGYILRSGAAPGADRMFEKSTTGEKEIYLPWPLFNGSDSPLYIENIDRKKVQEAEDISKKYHPAWCKLTRAAQKLMIRNVFQVLGKDLETPSEFVVCWTSNGGIKGGTGQAMRIATDMKIPIFNLYRKDDLHNLKVHITEKNT